MQMNKEDMLKIAEVLNQKFGPPFLNEGDVVVKVMSETEYMTGEEPEALDNNEEYILSFNIGLRDVQVDSSFNFLSAGTIIYKSDNDKNEIIESTGKG